jgi:hypothetical protein
MHEVVERFVGRYQVWRDERAARPRHNPLNAPAAIAALGIAQTVFDVLVRHHATWRSGLFTTVDIAFLILYFRKWQWAWLILPIWGISILTALPSVFTLPTRYPLSVVILSAVLGLALGIGCIVWGFAIRRRYYAHIEQEAC